MKYLLSLMGLLVTLSAFAIQTGFENGFGDWSAEGGVWQVGEPTAAEGPAAFGGTSVAGTVLGGNYSELSGSGRLVSPAFVVPSSGESPRFSYYQWYRFGVSDYGQLQVRVDGGEWTDVSGERVFANIWGAWSRRIVDLKEWAGQSIQLGFRFVSVDTAFAGDSNVGWYIDEVALETGAMSFDGSEDFEDGFGDWSAEGGVWQVGEPTAAEGPAAFGGTSVAGTVLGGNYSELSGSGRLVSPAFVVPSSGESPRFSYYQWYRFGVRDYGQLQVRVDGGEWTDVSGERVFANIWGAWSRRIVDLKEWAGQSIQLGFRFVSVDTAFAGDSNVGWYIDEVALETGAMSFDGSEDFEDGFGDWSAEGGVWQVGEPTAAEGPAAFGGTSVAGTVLGGNYSALSGSGRLVSPAFVVPSSGESPRFSYYQWYRFGVSDYGQLQVRVDGGEWTDVSGERVFANIWGAWSRRIVDLKEWAGQSIQLGFRFVSVDTAYSGDSNVGWYIDEVALETGPMSFDGSEDFENGFGDWSAEGGVWQVGEPTAAEGPAAFGGTSVAGTVLGGNYSALSGSGRLVSPAFVVPSSGESPRFSYYQWYRFGVSDYGQLQVRVDGGEWTDVSGERVFANIWGAWSRRIVDLKEWAGQSIQLGFRFVSVDTAYSGDSNVGWYIDEVALETGPMSFDGSEDFENGFGDWSAEGGVWQVGEPTAAEGPAAFGGTSVAGTVLGGNYSALSGSGRLVSPAFVVPSSGESPRFSYYQWYRFGVSDYGQLQVRVDGGEWTDVSGERVFANIWGAWSRRIVDLKEWAGQSIQLGFRFVSVDTAYSGDSNVGWYIDEVALETGPMSFDGSEDFEDGFGDWSAEGGVWQVGEPTAAEGPAAFGGTSVAGTVLGGNYSALSGSGRLVSPAFVVPSSGESPRFSYYQWYRFGVSDYGQLQVRVDGGEWTDVSGERVFANISGAWSRRIVDLREWAGQSIQLGFRFVSVDTAYSGDSNVGWYIDEVALETGPMSFDGSEDFENGFGDWSAEGGVWQVGEPTAAEGPAAFGGTSVAGTVLGGVSPLGSSARLVSPRFIVPPTIKLPVVAFYHWLDHAGTGTYAEVQIREIGGDWIPVSERFTRDNFEWQEVQIDLTSFAGKQVQLGFFLNSRDWTHLGWYLDNMQIATLEPDSIQFDEVISSEIALDNNRRLFAIEVPPGGHFNVVLNDLDDSGSNRVFLKRGAVPTAGSFDFGSTGASANHEIFVPDADAGTWFILVVGDRIPEGAESNPFELTAQFESGIFLTDVKPEKIGNSSLAVLQLYGAGFDRGVSAEIRDSSNNVSFAETILVSESELRVDFDPRQLDEGAYTLTIFQGDQERNLPIEIISGGVPILETDLIIPNRVGRHAAATIFVEYANVGEVAMPAPLLILQGSDRALLTLDPALGGRGFWTSAVPDGFSNSLQILGSGQVPGILQPGERIRVPALYVGLQRPWDFGDGEVSFNLAVFDSENDAPIDWNLMGEDIKPDSLTDEQWNALWGNLEILTGPSWGDYVNMLSDNAVYLGQLGIEVTDVAELLAFALARADGLSAVPNLAASTDAGIPQPGLNLVFSRMYPSSITQRLSKGIFGYGWSHNWDYGLRVESDGTVVINGPVGSSRRFQPDSRGGYFSQAGDSGILDEATNNGYTITEANGLQMLFDADGRLIRTTDTNGNSVTASYTGKLLTRLDHSSGGHLVFSYNANNQLVSVTDSFGKVVTYSYSNNQLTAATAYGDMTTTYSYGANETSNRNHALQSVHAFDGTIQSFSYDFLGRISRIAGNEGAEATSFFYDQPGRVTIENAVGDTFSTWFNHQGQIARLEDAAGNSTHFKYDRHLNLTEVTAPDGASTRLRYDDKGNPISSLNPLGHEIETDFTDLGRLERLTDARGNPVSYEYSNTGNATAMIYADGSRVTYDYDDKGQLMAYTNRRGQTIHLTRDSHGRVIRKDTPEGRTFEYFYDDRGNLILADDTLLGETKMEYNERDLLTRVTYPGNKWIDYKYDSANRRTVLEQYNGAIQRYTYDDSGRLESLLDGDNNLIIRYLYDTAGRLVQEIRGNDTTSEYLYFNTGNIASIIHRAPDNSIMERFDYTYDENGLRTSETSLEGTTTYEYDLIGQLTGVTYPNGDITTYEYDPAGNRTRVVENGVETLYETNELNQYAKAGDEILIYDADGNLSEIRTSRSSTLFTFDSENRISSIHAPESSLVSIDYNAFGNATRHSSGDDITESIYDVLYYGQLLAKSQKDSSSSTIYFNGIGPALMTTEGTSNYYGWDEKGNNRLVTGVTGTPREKLSYTPFGEKRTPNSSPTIRYGYGSQGRNYVITDQGGSNVGNGIYVNPNYAKTATTRSFYTLPPSIPPPRIPNARGPMANSPYLPSSLGNSVGSVNNTNPGNDLANALLPEILTHSGSGLGKLNRLLNSNTLKNVSNDLKAAGRALGRGLPILDIVSSGFDGWAGDRAAALNGYVKTIVGFGIGVTAFAILGPGFVPALVAGILSVAATRLYDAIGDLLGNLGQSLGDFISRIANAIDPNEMIGPGGYGTGNYLKAMGTYAYRINYENFEEATAPAQVVEIRNPLPENVDASTLEFTDFGFGDFYFIVPPGLNYYEHSEEVTILGYTFEVFVELSIDLETREVFARFQSLELNTGWPLPVDFGFLPPENGTGRGMGHMAYIIEPKPELPTGTEIRNIGFITFDPRAGGITYRTDLSDEKDPDSPPDSSRQALVTIDMEPPTSEIQTFPPTVAGSTFIVKWAGSDNGSGIKGYDIYTQKNGGDWELWLTDTVATMAVWSGESETNYGFYSVATDGVGFSELPPDGDTIAQASVTTPEGRSVWYAPFNLIDGWYVSDWFGSFSFVDSEFPYLYHKDHGILYALDAGESVYLFDWSMGWIFTNRELFPFFWDDLTENWIYFYDELQLDHRWFYVYDSGDYLKAEISDPMRLGD